MLTRRHADDGFTLVELLLAIVMLGIIIVPLANMVINALRQTDQSSGRLAESHDAQISAAYWAADVSSIGTRSTVDPLNPQLLQSVETNVAYNAGQFPCGTAGTPVAIVRFAPQGLWPLFRQSVREARHLARRVSRARHASPLQP